MVKRINLDENKIKDMYLNQKKSSGQIAKELGCHRSHISRILKRNSVILFPAGFFIKGSNPKKGLNAHKSEIIKMYVEDKMSSSKISKKFNCHSSAIISLLKRNGIKFFSSGFFLLGKPSPIKMDLNEEFIRSSYINDKKSTKQIAKLMKCTDTTIINRLKKMGISRRNGSEAMTGIKRKPLTEEHKRNLGKSIKESYNRYPELRHVRSKHFKKIVEDSKRSGRYIEKEKKRLISLKKGYECGRNKAWNKDKTHLDDKRILAGEKIHTFNNWSSIEPYDKKFVMAFKNQIRKRDNQICMLCGIHREKLKVAFDVHHINYDKTMSIPENCISLCHDCHPKTNPTKMRSYWTKFFQSLLSEKYGYEYSDNGEITLEISPIQGGLK